MQDNQVCSSCVIKIREKMNKIIGGGQEKNFSSLSSLPCALMCLSSDGIGTVV